MKEKWVKWIAVLCMAAIVMSGCEKKDETKQPTESGEKIWNYIEKSEKLTAVLEADEEMQIERFDYYAFTEGGGEGKRTTDQDLILSVIEALDKVQIVGESDIYVTDSDENLQFHLVDGTKISFTLEAGMLSTQKTNYELENTKALRTLLNQVREEGERIE